MTRSDFMQGLHNYGVDCNSQTGFYEVALFAEIITIESAIESGAFDPVSMDMTAEEFMQEIGYEHFLDSLDMYAEALQEMADRYLNRRQKAMNLENGMRYWCWWMSRYIWYRGKIGDQFMFEDVAGVHIRLTQKQIERLRVNP